MTILHQAPELRCDLCQRDVETVHDGDSFVAWERGWGRTNVAELRSIDQWPAWQRAEYDRVQAILGYNASLYTDGDIGCHVCPNCVEKHGIDLESDWPFIDCSHRRAPEVIQHAV